MENEPDVEGTLYIPDWDEFLEQVQEREPHRWVYDSQQLSGPMGDGGMPNIMTQLTTTPAYQLFLATIDLAGCIDFQQEELPDAFHLSRRFGGWSDFIATIVGGAIAQD